MQGVKTINVIAQDYGVHPMQLSQLKGEIQDQVKKLFEGKRGPQSVLAHSTPNRFYGEIGCLKMELDWLKKVRDQPTVTRLSWINAGVARVVNIR